MLNNEERNALREAFSPANQLKQIERDGMYQHKIRDGAAALVAATDKHTRDKITTEIFVIMAVSCRHAKEGQKCWRQGDGCHLERCPMFASKEPY